MILNSPYISGSATITGNLTVNGTMSGTISGTSSYAENANLLDGRDSLTFAGTGSNNFVGTQNINGNTTITGSLTTTGTITAQTLNVQQVTSSIVYSSGSNVFGNSLSNTQSMTGSVEITGSLSVNGISTAGLVSGTTNYIPKFTAANTIGNSQIFDNGTNVGINQPSPTRTLDILGASGIGTVLKLQGASGTTTYLQLAYNGATDAQSGYIGYNSSSQMQLFTANTLRATIDATGNLGLGVTPSASSVVQFQIASRAIFTSVSNSTAITNNATQNSGYKYIASAGASLYEMENGGHIFYTAPSGTAGNAISFTQAMTLFANGNLAVGTTTDAGYKLDVNGTLRATGAATFSSSVTANNRIEINGNDSVLNLGADKGGGAIIRYNSNGNLDLIPRSGFNTTIQGGNVGIGTTSPDRKLTINSGATGALRIDTDNGVQGFSMSPNSIFGIDEPGVGNGRFAINTNGNVSISSTAIGNDGGSKELQIYGSNSTNAAMIRLTQMWNGLAYYSNVICASDPSAGAASSLMKLQTSFYDGTIGAPSTSTALTIRYNGVIEFNQYGSGTLSTNASGVISASDGRYKNKTRDIENALDKVLQLNPIYYRWKEDCIFHTEYEELGFIAQEVAYVIPEASPEDEQENKYKNYSDRAIIAVLVKAVQEQQAQIEELNNRIIELENK